MLRLETALLIAMLLVGSVSSLFAYEEPGYSSWYWYDKPGQFTRYSSSELYTPGHPGYPYDPFTYGKYSGLHWSPAYGWRTGRGPHEPGQARPLAAPVVPQDFRRGFYEYYGR